MANIQLRTPIPGPRSQQLMKERNQHVSRSPFHVTPLFVRRAHGALIEDVDGNQLIDFSSGIGVTTVGHTPQSIVHAIREQSGLLLHSSFNVIPHESYVRLAETLNKITPGRFHKKTFLANSGAEAVENAIKIARSFTGRPGVICFDHAFHGRTYLALSLTSKHKPYKVGFGPFNSDIHRTPFPYPYRQQAGFDCFQALKDLVLTRVGADQTAAVILEPVLGEGGFVPAPKSFLADLREFCTEHKIVLIADEIQCGFGRTGDLFASQTLEFEPDLLILGKSLAGGLPLSAVVGRAEMMDAPIVGAIGGTYGGNPVACQAALAVIEKYQDGTLLRQARLLADNLQNTLRSWQETSPHIGEVRGLGVMQAIELVKNTSTKEPYPEMASNVVKTCYENGLIVMTAGSYGNVIRLLMPLTIESAALQEGLGVLKKAIYG